MLVTVHIPADQQIEKETSARQILKTLGLDMRPLHPGSTDPSLASFYVVQADASRATDVVNRLKQRGITAFVKPADAMP